MLRCEHCGHFIHVNDHVLLLKVMAGDFYWTYYCSMECMNAGENPNER